MASGDKNYDIAKESSQQIIIDNITAEVADKATLDSINTKIDTLDGVADNINANIGATGNTGGTTTAGTVMAKLNALLTSWTSTRAGYVDNIRSYTVTNNTASKTGVLSAKLAYVISLLENTTYGLNALKTAVSGITPGASLTDIMKGVHGLYWECEVPGTHYVTVPTGVNQIKLTACGGGGGGFAYYSSGCSSYYGYGGGGAAAISNKAYTVTAGSVLKIIVGAGGAGGVYTNSNGSTGANQGKGYDGENTIVGSLVTLAGGKAATKSSGGAAGGTGGGAGGARGAAGSAGLAAGGPAGSYKQSTASSAQTYAGGGGGSLGVGGTGGYVDSNNVGHPGDATKGGGGGGGWSSTVRGGKGGDGYVKIEWVW